MITEEDGVKMIQYLLSLRGLSEPEETSRKNWNKFSEEEKETTIHWYNYFKSMEL